ncbi:hypothetical protein Q0590_08460 [Rhodocytophaga aerolata]|uniref:Uncharacterized protein n=1 Tax=Rhodocytophaga aerolata TaxID=455078 RepID=A0ABT8R2E6_9BACT|nr:hypothetical protein [Rhodocytophaga aerolata]MDO1446281.1 hypothetical protein [Rhodocytophaga aerolata]
MATTTQQAPKSTTQASLTFYHKNFFHIKQLAADTCKEFQELIDALAPEIKAALPEDFELANLEPLFRKERVKQLPGWQAFEAAGVDLTGQVKLQPAELALMEEVRNPSFSQGSVNFKPKGNFRYKNGKVCLETTQLALDQNTLILEGLAMETYNKLTTLYNSIIPERENELEKMALRNKAAWFVSLEMLTDARDWTIDGKECLINPSVLKHRLGLLSHF